MNQFAFGALAFIIQIFCVILFAIFGEFNYSQFGDEYNKWQDINIFVFVGFGFLLSIPRRSQFSSLTYTIFIAAASFQLYPIWYAIWDKAFTPSIEFKIQLNFSILIQSSFSAASMMVSLGAVIGRASAHQVAISHFFQIIAYTLNQRLQLYFEASDIGGCMVIFLFGSVFGLVLSFVIGNKQEEAYSRAEPSYYSNVISTIGALFIWAYYPSFNSIFATSDLQSRAIFNTIISLSASTLFSAFISGILTSPTGRIRFVDFRNAALAGGVTMGTCSNMYMHPAFTIGIGLFAGLISCTSYSLIQPSLYLYDTIGTFSLFFLPSLFGAAWGATIAAVTSLYDKDYRIQVFPNAYDEGWTDNKQGGYQASAMFISIGIAIVGGAVVGIIAKLIGDVEKEFDDAETFELPQIRFGDYWHLNKLPDQQQVGQEKIAGGCYDEYSLESGDHYKKREIGANPRVDQNPENPQQIQMYSNNEDKNQ